MITLIFLVIPVLFATYFMAFKLPKKAKDVVFKNKTTTFIAATVISFVVGHVMLGGVIATYAALLMDTALTPIFMGIRWAHIRSKNKQRIVHELPEGVAVVPVS